MRIPAMTKDLIDAVMRYNDGVYLHQSIVRSGDNLSRHVDLPDAVTAFGEAKPTGVANPLPLPVFLADLGEISSTRSDLRRELAALRQRTRSSHLEVETYNLGRSARQHSHRFQVGGHRARDRILPPGTVG